MSIIKKTKWIIILTVVCILAAGCGGNSRPAESNNAENAENSIGDAPFSDEPEDLYIEHITMGIYDHDEYIKYTEETDLSNNFVKYSDISYFGEFESYIYSPYSDSYIYFLTAKSTSGEKDALLELRITPISDTDWENTNYMHCSAYAFLDDSQIDPKDMRKADIGEPVVIEKDGMISYEVKAYRKDNICYTYRGKDGTTGGVCWKNGGLLYELGHVYGYEESESGYEKLMDIDIAEKTLTELGLYGK